MRLVAPRDSMAAGKIAPPAESPGQRRFTLFAWGVLIYNLLVILWGALVRATGSGAGCGGHWPLCNGDVLPDLSRIGTVIELTHRIMSGLALMAVAAMFVWSRRAFPAHHRARRWSGWSLVFILTEALLGASLVLLGHVAKNESAGRVYSLATHLTNTFLLLASLALTAWYAGSSAAGGEPKLASSRPKLAVAGPLVGLLVVAVAGAITALGDTLFPSNTLLQGMRDDFSSTASVLIRLRIIHPLLALAEGFVIAMGVLPVYRTRGKTRLQALSKWLLALYIVQIAAGGGSILLRAPVPLQLLHLLLADAIWIALVLFLAEREAPELFTAGGLPEALAGTREHSFEGR